MPKAKKLSSLGCRSTMIMVRFHRHGLPTDLSSKDYAFSPLSINEGIAIGFEQGKAALKNPAWLQSVPKDTGAVLYDVFPHDHTQQTHFHHDNKKRARIRFLYLSEAAKTKSIAYFNASLGLPGGSGGQWYSVVICPCMSTACKVTGNFHKL